MSHRGTQMIKKIYKSLIYKTIFDTLIENTFILLARFLETLLEKKTLLE
jgi:hypothetical protein